MVAGLLAQGVAQDYIDSMFSCIWFKHRDRYDNNQLELLQVLRLDIIY